MSLCQHVCGQYSSTQTGPVGGVWAALLDCLAFGTYFPASGLDRTARRETWEDRRARLPRGDAIPEV